ncbi:MAG TPA: MBL fold metallo-hydrolase [Patescibacteria group bacterium]|nr:MBL fold metallo-hydrolase [Patescibacteria group bacterium]
MRKYFLLTLTSLFLLAGIFFYQNAKLNDGKLHVVVCDVGQGDGILIRTPNGSDILVDGGPDDSILNCLSSHLPFWDRTIELMVLTHPHTDHAAGLVDVLKRYTVLHFVTEKVLGQTATYKRLEDSLAAQKLTAKYLFAGDRVDLTDKTELLTLWPSAEWLIQSQLQAANGINDNQNLDLNGFCLVQLFTYGNFTMLLTGDAGANVEDKIAAEAGKVGVLKVPHHGSKTGMSDYFLSVINPSLAIISVGANNRYGHPAQSALDLLKSHNIKTLRTDKNGAVEVVSDGQTFSIN